MSLPVAPGASAPNGNSPEAVGRKRRPPDAAEQARRKAWGSEYGKVMHGIKQAHEKRGQ